MNLKKRELVVFQSKKQEENRRFQVEDMHWDVHLKKDEEMPWSTRVLSPGGVLYVQEGLHLRVSSSFAFPWPLCLLTSSDIGRFGCPRLLLCCFDLRVCGVVSLGSAHK